MIALGQAAGLPGCSRVSMRGVRVDAIDGQQPIDLVRRLLSRGGLQHVVTANVNYVREGAARDEVRDVLERAALVVPDGMPVVWAARLSGRRASGRVTGHDMVDALVQLSISDGVRLFFLGGAADVAERAAEVLRRRHPGVDIAGVYAPPVSGLPYPAEEDRRMVEAVNSSGADALLVALGCPKQDLWTASHRDELKVSVAMGVGCVLDVIAGEVQRSPRWLQALGAEWLYRLYQEPRRLAGRYLRDAAFLAPLFADCAIQRIIHGRRP